MVKLSINRGLLFQATRRILFIISDHNQMPTMFKPGPMPKQLSREKEIRKLSFEALDDVIYQLKRGRKDISLGELFAYTKKLRDSSTLEESPWKH